MRVAAADHAPRHDRGLGILGGGKLPFELVRQPDIVGIKEGEPVAGGGLRAVVARDRRAGIGLAQQADLGEVARH